MTIHFKNLRVVHPDLSEEIPDYDQLLANNKGQRSIKKAGVTYLPQPNADDKSDANLARYDAYVLRAIFYNVLGRTLAGLVGQVFVRPPEAVIPTALEPLETNIDGTGLTLKQFGKKSLGVVLLLGRAGMYTDFPNTEIAPSKADVAEKGIRPTITIYNPKSVIDWRTQMRGALKILSYVVIAETYEEEIETTPLVVKTQYRVLRLIEDVYTVEIWRENNTTEPFEKFTPKANGKTLDEIPFTFVGAVDNDPGVDKSPLIDMSNINIGHYRNSADYEESVFVIGQPTLWVSGLTEVWLKDTLKGVIRLGSLGGLPLPVNATAGILQVEPNTMAIEAMHHKEDQMIALGAKVMEPSKKERTATEVRSNDASETSVLSSSADNVSAAMTFCLRWAARFAGVADTEDVSYTLNTDYSGTKMTPEERKQLVIEMNAGVLAYPEVRENLRLSGLTSLSDEDALKLIEQEKTKRIADAQALKATAAEPTEEE